MSSGVLCRPGVAIYYEIRGSGPPLLIIPAAHGTHLTHEDLALRLSSQYTVIGFDRRGSLRSRFLSPPTEQQQRNLLKDTVDDIVALIQHLSPDQPVLIYSISLGCMHALELLTSYPDLVRQIIVHDPCIPCLLPKPSFEQVSAAFQSTVSLYKSQGPAAASEAFVPVVTSDEDRALLRFSPAHKKLLALSILCFNFLFEHELPILLEYRISYPALKAYRDKITLIRGELSTTPLTTEPITTLGGELGLPVKMVAGGHLPSATHPEAFTQDLLSILGEAV
ncbi:hypothetical protein AnigIFM50267_011105 [Aspergillus niger]|uniref:Alpha/beta-hydrolase n=1 Tax=Aspergillus welwitschiae TaxID=1341132 RepID=A0A3F3PWC5_9EURO|nr:alpha/beta-hydrolase [Aspergillus welwitschiae]RDH31251.1 alpha/beta-hydrolase [Aspergillus welwitschiae]GKZ66257.1 hypothetical protein AnigIFM50267_011105 [Aspergillus niger]